MLNSVKVYLRHCLSFGAPMIVYLWFCFSNHPVMLFVKNMTQKNLMMNSVLALSSVNCYQAHLWDSCHHIEELWM